MSMYYRHPRLLGLLILTYGWDRGTAMQTINGRHHRRDDSARQYIRAALSLRHCTLPRRYYTLTSENGPNPGLAYARAVAH